jgi:hypothetical protein
MNYRVVVGTALAVAGLALPAASAQATSYLFEQRDHLDRIGGGYDAWGPAQDIVVDVKGKGVPEFTDDQKGAQQIAVTDTRDTFYGWDRQIDPLYYDPTYDLPGQRSCHIDSAHSGHCDSDWSQQVTYHESHCNFPPDCEGLGASGLLQWMEVGMRGASARLRDVPGGTPLPWGVSAFNAGTRDVELWSPSSVNYRSSGDAADEVELHSGVGASTLDVGPGDDKVDVEDGATDTVTCGDGTDQVKADPDDSVAADCETVTRG